MSLVKQDLVNLLVSDIGLRQNEATDFVNDFFIQIKSEIIGNGGVKISGLGNWHLLHKEPRIGRNPKTGKQYPISQRTVVSFKPGVKFKKTVQAQSVLNV